jgi:hypothetical protein
MSQDETEDQGEVAGRDRRRARLEDLQRLEQTLSRAEGRLAEVEQALKVRDEGRVGKAQFYFHAYLAIMSHDPRNFKHLRAWTAEAWSRYNDDMDGKAPVGLEGEANYRANQDTKAVPRLGDKGNEAAGGVFTTKVFDVKAEPAQV